MEAAKVENSNKTSNCNFFGMPISPRVRILCRRQRQGTLFNFLMENIEKCAIQLNEINTCLNETGV